MKVTKLDIIGHTGENKRPISGDATFDDSRFYGWLINPDNEVVFFTYRSTHEGTSHSLISFRSAKRAEALRFAIENK